jgi:hypothetical protein
VYRWRNEDDDKRDTEATEIERLREEEKQVGSISCGERSADSKLIEHEADPDGSSKD